MRTNRIVWLVACAAIAAGAGYSQTAAELMQKGIYTQETAGDLDGAITIYRQIVNSGSTPRDLAAQAQYRMAQSLLQKGDLGNAATEFSNLARNYADYGRLVSSMAAQAHVVAGGAGGRGGDPAARARQEMELRDVQERLRKLADAANAQPRDPAKMAEVDKAKAELVARLAKLNGAGAAGPDTGLFNGVSFDGGTPVTVKGAVIESVWMNPATVLWLDPQDGSGKTYAFQTVAPNQLLKLGWTRQSVKLGDQLTISGVLAADGKTIKPNVFAASAATITTADGRKIFDRAAVQQ